MVMAISSLKTKITPILFQRLSSIILIYAGALSLNALYIQSIGSGIGIYSGLFHVTLISQILDIFIYIIGAAILLARPLAIYVNSTNITNILENNYKNSIEYCLLIMFSVLGASLLISSSNLISMYLSIELQSFAVYILSTLYRNSESATSAGLKYFLLGSLASCFILLGSGLIYTYTGLTNLESIYNLISVTEPINNLTLGIALGFIFIFAGFLLKVSAAPLHNWAPDVYDESPTIVTIWLTIMPKISILIIILEIFTQITTLNPILENINILGFNTITNLFLISSLISLIIGTVVGLAQTKIKRLLAYSTISHIGFILLALAINSKQSIDSFIFYIIQYTLTNLNTFLILLAIGYIINKTIINKGSEKDIKFISELKGIFYSNPIISLSLTICLLSMAGTPPFLGFFSKQFVLYSAIEKGYYFMAISGILVSIISASYYLKVIRILHTEIESNKSFNDETNIISDSTINISNIHSFLISSLTLLISFFVIKPSILLKSTQLLSLSIYST
jgi:NADH-ubiquinone oxidoreductase chain 2